MVCQAALDLFLRVYQQPQGLEGSVDYLQVENFNALQKLLFGEVGFFSCSIFGVVSASVHPLFVWDHS